MTAPESFAPSKAVEHSHRGQSIVLIVKKSPDCEFPRHRRLPPEDAFAAAVRRCHHHTIQLIEKGALALG